MIGYNSNVLQQTACLVVNKITVGNFTFLFNCTPVGRTQTLWRFRLKVVPDSPAYVQKCFIF